MLRNIIEQRIEFQKQMAINFIDFNKAFDSIHRESSWNIMTSDGVPGRNVNVVRKLYLNIMPKHRHLKTSINWTSPGECRRQERPRKTWRQTFQEDLKYVSITWEDVEKVAMDRTCWKTLVAQCDQHRT